MERRKSKSFDMTEGPLLGKILVFALPLMVTNLLQTFYNAADIIVVGLSTEPDAVGAIGITSSLVNLILNIFVGFSVGANVVVARNIGARDDERVSRSVHTAVGMGVIFGLVCAVVGFFISRPVLALMGAQGKVLELAAAYTRIYFLGVPFISLTNYACSILRARGDTRTPLIVLTLSGLLNVALNLFFVLVVGLSVEGVAIATAVSNAVSAVVLLWRLTLEKDACRLMLRRLRLHRDAFLDILHIGVPAAIQGMLFSLSNIIVQSSILEVNNLACPPDSAYQPVVRGHAAMSSIEGFLYTATNAVAQAAATFTSQNVGAQRYDRVRRAMGLCYLVSSCVAVCGTVLIYLLRTPLLGFYDVTNGAEGTLEAIAWDTAMARFEYVFIPYILLALMEVGSNVVRGLGRSVTSAVVSLAGACLLRIVWTQTIYRHYLNAGATASKLLRVIYLDYPVSWGATALVQFICALVLLHILIGRMRAAWSAETGQMLN